MNDQGDDRDSEPFMQYQGHPAHQQSERIFSDLSSRPLGTILGPPLTLEVSVNSIYDPKHHQVPSEVLDTFMGPPCKEDPNLVRLKEAGLRLARRVFYTKEAWPLKRASAYLSKYLSLVKEQREELESDLKKEEFLNLLEKQASFKATFDFRAKMNTQQRAQRATMVPLFTIPDKLVKIKISVDAIWGECGTKVLDCTDPCKN